MSANTLNVEENDVLRAFNLFTNNWTL